MHIQGAPSSDGYLTIEGISYATFLEAAKGLSLLETQHEWHKTLEEANSFRLPDEL